MGFLHLAACSFDEREDGYTRVAIATDAVETAVYGEHVDFTGAHLWYVFCTRNLKVPYLYRARPADEPLPSPYTLRVYVGVEPHPPTIDTPVIQSYVDVIVGGAIHAMGESFAYDFITLTSYWPGVCQLAAGLNASKYVVCGRPCGLNYRLYCRLHRITACGWQPALPFLTRTVRTLSYL